METQTLTNKAAVLINDASVSLGRGDLRDAQLCLVELRKLLNEHPEIETGGGDLEKPQEAPPGNEPPG